MSANILTDEVWEICSSKDIVEPLSPVEKLRHKKVLYIAVHR